MNCFGKSCFRRHFGIWQRNGKWNLKTFVFRQSLFSHGYPLSLSSPPTVSPVVPRLLSCLIAPIKTDLRGRSSSDAVYLDCPVLECSLCQIPWFPQRIVKCCNSAHGADGNDDHRDLGWRLRACALAAAASRISQNSASQQICLQKFKFCIIPACGSCNPSFKTN